MSDGLFYDQDGNPITLEEWSILLRGGVRVAAEQVGDAEVSTVWLGLNYNFCGGRPLIFETMIFGGEHDLFRWRYASKSQAEAGHNLIVARLQAGKPPD